MKYSIPESNMDKLTKRLVTIGNKCNKFGCTFSFEIIGEHYEKQFDDAHVYTGDIKYIDVEVSGKAIINNWVFVATLEHTDKGNIVRAYDGQEVPQWAYTVEAKCDHCKTKHTRKDTYIVRNTETGEFKQVGRSCLKDFTNGLSAEMVAAYLSYLDTLEKSSIDFSSSKPYYNVKEYLFYVAETVKHFGYLSKANAGYNGTPTSCRAFRYMVCPNAQERKEMESIGFEACTEENENTVVTALQWLNAQDDDFGYIHNLKIACSREYCESRDFGIIASLLPAHFKAMEKESERLAREAAKANKPKTNWVGEVGERIEIIADCKCVASWYSDFGPGYLYKFTSNDGNTFTWKTGKAVDDGKVVLKGTIKAHTEFNGEKQTELTRCKIS
jgi:hypothetical protein